MGVNTTPPCTSAFPRRLTAGLRRHADPVIDPVVPVVGAPDAIPRGGAAVRAADSPPAAIVVQTMLRTNEKREREEEEEESV